MHSPSLSNAAAHARLREYATSRASELVTVLSMSLTPSVKLSDFVGLVLGASDVSDVHRDAMVSAVLRSEVGTYLSRAEVRTIPAGRTDALPVFVKNRGESHAFLLPIPDELRQLLGRGGPSLWPGA